MLDQRVLRSGQALDANGTWYRAALRTVYDNTKTYHVYGSVRRSATANGDMYMGVHCFDAAGVALGAVWAAAGGVTPGTNWATYSGTVTGIPGGTAFLAPALVLNHAVLPSTGHHECQSLRLALSTATTVALNHDEFFRDAWRWAQEAATPGHFVRLPTGTPYAATLRFATAGYMTHAADTPPNTYVDGRVLQPALLRQEMPAEYAGAATVGYGELVLANADGALSELVYAGLDGQTVRVRQGDSAAALSSFADVFTATADQAIFNEKRLTIRLKDGLALLDRPLLTATFAGNNALPAGVEGGPDIKGLIKPRLFGLVQNLAPPCVNTSRLIYLVSDGGFINQAGAGGDITAVYDRGTALTAGTAYSSQADMEANAPAAGQYRIWYAGAMFRLGSTPAGLVTCDAGANTSGRGWQDVLTTIVKTAGLVSGQIDIESSYNVDSKPDNWTGAVTAEVGIWVDDARTALEAAEPIATSCGVMLSWLDLSGGAQPKLYAEAWPRPYAVRDDNSYGAVWYAGSAVLSIRPTAGSEAGAGVPAWRVQLGYSPVLQLQEFDVDAGVSQARKSFVANERRQLTASDTAIKTKHTNAVTLERPTQIMNEAAALDEATRQLYLRRYRRAWFEVTAALDGALESGGVLIPSLRPRLGGYVRLSHPALAITTLDGTRTTDGYFNVMALEIDHRARTARMTVRQATEPTL